MAVIRANDAACWTEAHEDMAAARIHRLAWVSPGESEVLTPLACPGMAPLRID